MSRREYPKGWKTLIDSSSCLDDDDETPPPGKVCERQTLIHGAHLRVYRRRADGFRRVEIQVFDVADITLYFSDEEMQNWHEAFAPELPDGAVPAWLQERRSERFMARLDAELAAEKAGSQLRNEGAR